MLSQERKHDTVMSLLKMYHMHEIPGERDPDSRKITR